jgi:hypothetical protein
MILFLSLSKAANAFDQRLGFQVSLLKQKGKTPSEKNLISDANFTFETKSSFLQ